MACPVCEDKQDKSTAMWAAAACGASLLINGSSVFLPRDAGGGALLCVCVCGGVREAGQVAQKSLSQSVLTLRLGKDLWTQCGSP